MLGRDVSGSDAADTSLAREKPNMTDATPPALVVSSVAYAVTQVDGQTPTALNEFEGTVTLVTRGPTGEHQVCGEGVDAHDGTVRFYQKDHCGAGKDVRVWTVSVTPAGEFVAAC